MCRRWCQHWSHTQHGIIFHHHANGGNCAETPIRPCVNLWNSLKCVLSRHFSNTLGGRERGLDWHWDWLSTINCLFYKNLKSLPSWKHTTNNIKRKGQLRSFKRGAILVRIYVSQTFWSSPQRTRDGLYVSLCNFLHCGKKQSTFCWTHAYLTLSASTKTISIIHHFCPVSLLNNLCSSSWYNEQY